MAGLRELVNLPRPLLIQIFSHFSLLELNDFIQLAPVFSWVLEDDAFEVLMGYAVQKNPSLISTFDRARDSCSRFFPGIEDVLGPMLDRLKAQAPLTPRVSGH